jgi:hypothetical protein
LGKYHSAATESDTNADAESVRNAVRISRRIDSAVTIGFGNVCLSDSEPEPVNFFAAL